MHRGIQILFLNLLTGRPKLCFSAEGLQPLFEIPLSVTSVKKLHSSKNELIQSYFFQYVAASYYFGTNALSVYRVPDFYRAFLVKPRLKHTVNRP